MLRALARELLWFEGVPTQLHEVLVEMFRVRPELARDLIETCAGVAVAEGACESASADLSQVAPSEYRADAVTVIRRADDVAAAIIVEVQLAADPDKLRTWPVYVTALRARLGCAVSLLVIAPDHVARWARQPIAIGHPGFVLEPVVVAFSEVPRVSVEEARRSPELAIMSVLAHREVEVARIALAAIDVLPEEPGALYFDLILNAFEGAARQLLEDTVLENYEFQSHFIVSRLRASREEGREEGRAEARESLRRAAIELVRTKLGAVAEADLERIRNLGDDQALVDLIVAVGAAADAAHVRVALDRLFAA